MTAPLTSTFSDLQSVYARLQHTLFPMAASETRTLQEAGTMGSFLPASKLLPPNTLDISVNTHAYNRLMTVFAPYTALATSMRILHEVAVRHTADPTTEIGDDEVAAIQAYTGLMHFVSASGVMVDPRVSILQSVVYSVMSPMAQVPSQEKVTAHLTQRWPNASENESLFEFAAESLFQICADHSLRLNQDGSVPLEAIDRFFAEVLPSIKETSESFAAQIENDEANAEPRLLAKITISTSTLVAVSKAQVDRVLQKLESLIRDKSDLMSTRAEAIREAISEATTSTTESVTRKTTEEVTEKVTRDYEGRIRELEADIKATRNLANLTIRLAKQAVANAEAFKVVPELLVKHGKFNTGESKIHEQMEGRLAVLIAHYFEGLFDEFDEASMKALGTYARAVNRGVTLEDGSKIRGMFQILPHEKPTLTQLENAELIAMRAIVPLVINPAELNKTPAQVEDAVAKAGEKLAKAIMIEEAELDPAESDADTSHEPPSSGTGGGESGRRDSGESEPIKSAEVMLLKIFQDKVASLTDEVAFKEYFLRALESEAVGAALQALIEGAEEYNGFCISLLETYQGITSSSLAESDHYQPRAISTNQLITLAAMGNKKAVALLKASFDTGYLRRKFGPEYQDVASPIFIRAALVLTVAFTPREGRPYRVYLGTLGDIRFNEWKNTFGMFETIDGLTRLYKMRAEISPYIADPTVNTILDAVCKMMDLFSHRDLFNLSLSDKTVSPIALRSLGRRFTPFADSTGNQHLVDAARSLAEGRQVVMSLSIPKKKSEAVKKFEAAFEAIDARYRERLRYQYNEALGYLAQLPTPPSTMIGPEESLLSSSNTFNTVTRVRYIDEFGAEKTLIKKVYNPDYEAGMKCGMLFNGFANTIRFAMGRLKNYTMRVVAAEITEKGEFALYLEEARNGDLMTPINNQLGEPSPDDITYELGALHAMTSIIIPWAGMHKRGFVHLDIKPGNAVVTVRGIGAPDSVRVIDLDSVRHLEEDAPFLDGKEDEDVTGTFLPGDAILRTRPDFRTDVFAAGYTLYQYLTVARVGPGYCAKGLESIKERLHATGTKIPSLDKVERIQMDADLFAKLPESIQAIILQATATHAEDRYDTLSEMLEAITEAIDVHSRDVEVDEEEVIVS